MWQSGAALIRSRCLRVLSGVWLIKRHVNYAGKSEKDGMSRVNLKNSLGNINEVIINYVPLPVLRKSLRIFGLI